MQSEQEKLEPEIGREGGGWMRMDVCNYANMGMFMCVRVFVYVYVCVYVSVCVCVCVV